MTTLDLNALPDEFDFEQLINDMLLAPSGNWVADNFDMHEKFGVTDAVDKLDKTKLLALLKFRLDFLQEELNEARLGYDKLVGLQATEIATDAVLAEGDLAAEDVVDAMIDLCVVAIGTLNAFQVDAYEAWERVHIANMSKEVGIKASRPNPLGLPDLIKPAGWVGPRHDDNLGILPRLYGGIDMGFASFEV
jgi:predicted HAD superfamily Cof-like phosphohydrolase